MILPLDLNLFLNQSVKQKLCVIKDKEYKIIWPWQMTMHIGIILFYGEIFNEKKLHFDERNVGKLIYVNQLRIKKITGNNVRKNKIFVSKFSFLFRKFCF